MLLGLKEPQSSLQKQILSPACIFKVEILSIKLGYKEIVHMKEKSFDINSVDLKICLLLGEER